MQQKPGTKKRQKPRKRGGKNPYQPDGPGKITPRTTRGAKLKTHKGVCKPQNPPNEGHPEPGQKGGMDNGHCDDMGGKGKDHEPKTDRRGKKKPKRLCHEWDNTPSDLKSILHPQTKDTGCN